MSDSSAIAIQPASRLPWQRGVMWLLFLGPFFFLSYGYANHSAANRAVMESIVFGWEQHIPFVPWTIIPYWSIDAFYGLSFLLCRNAAEVDRHALRLLTAQLISISCFLLFPLHFTFARPATDGMFGAMFDALMGFDQPYNQAPSLHISLLVILWSRFAQSTRGGWRWLVHGWSLLIGLSVLTTYQHHFFDIPTGALAGLLCLWLWPDAHPSPLTQWRRIRSSRHVRLATYYLLGSVLCAGLALWLAGVALWLLWPALALAWVGLGYAGWGVQIFQKHEGRFSLAATLLLAPYLVGAWLNSRAWTRRHPAPDEIAAGVWLGRMPSQAEMAGSQFSALLDLTAELPAPQGNWHYLNLPWQDMVIPDAAQLLEAAQQIETMRSHGPVLVCCALGYTRSACAVAAWLLSSGRAASVDEAIACIAAQRPQVVMGAAHRQVLARVQAQTRSTV